jgi:hypothetical protein
MSYPNDSAMDPVIHCMQNVYIYLYLLAAVFLVKCMRRDGTFVD